MDEKQRLWLDLRYKHQPHISPRDRLHIQHKAIDKFEKGFDELFDEIWEGATDAKDL